MLYFLRIFILNKLSHLYKRNSKSHEKSCYSSSSSGGGGGCSGADRYCQSPTTDGNHHITEIIIDNISQNNLQI